jgi:hypothetical protein
METVKWSYSSLSLFQQCPKKYYELRVVKKIKDAPTTAIMYGLEAHKIAEEYIRDGKEIPPAYAYLKPILDSLVAMEGEKHCEMKLAVTKDLTPCSFTSSDAWWRGIADLVILQGETARILDYKTGKSQYADTKQLELLSLAVFAHYPQIQNTKTGLLFVVHNDFVPAAYDKADSVKLWEKWRQETARLDASYKNDVWNPTQNFTCRSYCPVTDCHHNGKHK